MDCYYITTNMSHSYPSFQKVKFLFTVHTGRALKRKKSIKVNDKLDKNML